MGGLKNEEASDSISAAEEGLGQDTNRENYASPCLSERSQRTGKARSSIGHVIFSMRQKGDLRPFCLGILRS